MKRSQKKNKSKSKKSKKKTKKDNGSFKYPITDYISPTITMNSTFFPYKYPIFDNYYTHFSNLHNRSSYNSSYACCSQYNDDFDSF